MGHSSSRERTTTADTYIVDEDCNKLCHIDHFRHHERITPADSASESDCEHTTRYKRKKKTSTVVVHPPIYFKDKKPPKTQLTATIMAQHIYSPYTGSGSKVQELPMPTGYADYPRPGDYNYMPPQQVVYMQQPPQPRNLFLPPFKEGQTMFIPPNNPPTQYQVYHPPVNMPYGGQIRDLAIPGPPKSDKVLMVQLSNGKQRYLRNPDESIMKASDTKPGAIFIPEIQEFVRWNGL